MGLLSRIAQAQNRSDGYTQEQSAYVCAFQQAVETSNNPDYAALRAVLAESRTHNMDYSAMMNAYHKLAK